MKYSSYISLIAVGILLLSACRKKSSGGNDQPVATTFMLNSWTINGATSQSVLNNVSSNASIKLHFSAPIQRSSVAGSISITKNGSPVTYNASYSNADSTVILTPSSPFSFLTKYNVSALAQLRSTNGATLYPAFQFDFITSIDSTDKFPLITDSSLVQLVQQQTFKYFWDFGHLVSGLARERNSSGETVTSGGSGFGIMAIITGIHRNFISRGQGLARIQTLVSFLKNTAQKFHGAFPHWLNGTTGVVVPFSTKDNGADLVETSYLMQGLLCARQYFNNASPEESALRNDIDTLWNGVQWSWFRKNNENVLYWHWSPNYNWDMNMPIRGWNECLITYVLAASSTTSPIPKIVYDNGFAQNGAMRNNNSYYGYQLPLGPPYGGPLFFSHYSFLGINPFSLTDAYADYQKQVVNHTRINYEYCKANPNGYYGYSDESWGLTASDVPNGYTASSPTNDVGVIAPTAALSSFPYTPVESMKALKFFYYKLGDKLWGPYGFYDAFSLKDQWFANSFLAIDQGPIIVMIENYRSGLLWNLFMSCPEIKNGMHVLGFQSPYL
jgi:hypothetical protein